METGEIVQAFNESGFQIDPHALEILKTSGSPQLIEKILNSIDSSVMVVGAEHILAITKNEKISKKKKRTKSQEVIVLSDITDNSSSIGEYTDFVQYFRNRYALLSEMLRKRISARPIESLRRRNLDTGEPFSIIGMVLDIRTTANGHKLIEVEDTTGSVRVLVHKDRNKELFEYTNSILLDEVIGITGTLSSDGNIIFANSIIKPDLPNPQKSTLNGNKEGKAVFISDIHVGSKTFLEDAWLKFVEWLSEEIDYLVIAGDIVDGIGVFPNQEKELAIKDIYEQYEKAAEYLNALPEHIKIIISPGNHDAVRQAEPQPSLPEKIRRLFRSDITFVGNPAMVEIGGAKVLIYHGRALDDIIASIPGYTYDDPTKPMIEMLRLRHLSPIYGGRVSIAPEKKDYFVIDTIPDILHCGHIHTVGIARYKEVLTINSGAWQSQTEFQKRMNLNPVPARATVVDLSDMHYEVKNFLF